MRQRGASPGPTPIEVEGAVQVFLDPECTQYATGVVHGVYVRFNRAFGFGDIKEFQEGEGSRGKLVINTPSTMEPDLGYEVILWDDFYNDDDENPFTAGQVVYVEYGLPDYEEDVTGYTVIFHDD